MIDGHALLAYIDTLAAGGLPVAEQLRAVRIYVAEMVPSFSGSREQSWEQLRALGYGELDLRYAAGDK